MSDQEAPRCRKCGKPFTEDSGAIVIYGPDEVYHSTCCGETIAFDARDDDHPDVAVIDPPTPSRN